MTGTFGRRIPLPAKPPRTRGRPAHSFEPVPAVGSLRHDATLAHSAWLTAGAMLSRDCACDQCCADHRGIRHRHYRPPVALPDWTTTWRRCFDPEVVATCVRRSAPSMDRSIFAEVCHG